MTTPDHLSDTRLDEVTIGDLDDIRPDLRLDFANADELHPPQEN